MAQIEIKGSAFVNDMGAVEDAFHKILPETNRKGEWFNIEAERVLPMLHCLGSTQGQQPRPSEPTGDPPDSRRLRRKRAQGGTGKSLPRREAEALEHFKGGKNQAQTARAMGLKRISTIVRNLRNKGYPVPGRAGNSPSASRQATKQLGKTKAAVLRLRKTGKTYQAIADELNLKSTGTVWKHVKDLEEMRLLP